MRVWVSTVHGMLARVRFERRREGSTYVPSGRRTDAREERGGAGGARACFIKCVARVEKARGNFQVLKRSLITRRRAVLLLRFPMAFRFLCSRFPPRA